MSSYRFGEFSLDPEARILLRRSEPVSLAGKTLDTLIVLVQNRGRLVDKDELLARIWPGTAVEDGNLTQSIFTLRKILGDSPKNHRYIATIAGRGYQFVAPVSESLAEPAAPRRRFWQTKRVFYFGTAAVAIAAAAALWFAWRRPTDAPADFIQQRLTFNSNANSLRSAAISPDGRYLAYSDPAGIHIKVLATGDERLLPKPAANSDALWHVDSWFPDGTQLLAHSETNGRKDLWTTSVVGQSSRKLRDGASGWSVSPDGTQIAFSPAQPFRNFREIWIMSSAGEGAHKVFAARPDESLSSVNWSPDGERLAYIRLQVTPLTICQSIETCDRHGENRKTALPVQTKSGQWIEALSWLPNGRIVYSQVESPGSDDENLWVFAVDSRTGGAISKPKRITRWGGSAIYGLSRTADGKRLVLLKTLFRSEAYVGRLEAGGRRLNRPYRLTEDEASNSASAWTADGKAVVFLTNRVQRWGIFKQELDGETAELLVSGSQNARLPRISADGQWVLYLERPATADQKTPARLMRVPVNGGVPQPVLETRNPFDWQCARSGGICVILESADDDKRFLLYQFDPLKGRGKLLRSITKPHKLIDCGDFDGLAPDGATFALASKGPENRIRLFSLVGGPDREITVPGYGNLTSLDWAADAKSFYCGSTSSQHGAILHVDLQGNARVVWESRELAGGGASGIPSPDGKYLLIWADLRDSNAWMIENF